MNEFTIKMAGHRISVDAMEMHMSELFAEYLCDETPEISVSTTPEDLDLERQKSAREDALEGREPRSYPTAYLETIAIQRKITEALFAHDTLLFHGSVIAVDGEAFLITAKSGTGKSTHTRLWRELLGDRAVMVNDDKPFLQILEDGVLVHGSPWNGKHRLGSNISVPLKAICILERGEKNEIAPISAKEAVMMLMQQSCRPMDGRKMPKYLELLDGLSRRVAFYRLKCTIDPEAAKLSYETMSGKLLQ